MAKITRRAVPARPGADPAAHAQPKAPAPAPSRRPDATETAALIRRPASPLEAIQAAVARRALQGRLSFWSTPTSMRVGRARRRRPRPFAGVPFR